MFENIIVEQNPFWEKELRFDLIERENFDKIKSFLETKHILTIVGVRRSGKSTLLKQIINYLIKKKGVNAKNILNLNLENTYFNNYRNDIETLEKIYEEYLVLTKIKGKKYIILDEIQFFNNWQVFVKSKYELDNEIKFIITGSNSWMLSSEFSTLLSGRNIEFLTYPLSFNEICNYKKINLNSNINIISNRVEIKSLFFDYMKFGGFPEIFLLENKENFKLILQSYSKNILYQDIAPRFEIKKLRDLERLYIYFLSNYNNLYSYNKLSKIFDINDKTIKEYIKYFQEAFLLYEIEKFDYSLKKQLVNDKKVYISDLGFINAISFKFSEDKGRLLENLVFIELKRRGNEIYYHKQKKECDFVIKEGLEITHAIQVTKSLEDIDTKKREIAGLIDACKSYKLKMGLILTEDEEYELEQDGVKIQVMPIWKWLLTES